MLRLVLGGALIAGGCGFSVSGGAGDLAADDAEDPRLDGGADGPRMDMQGPQPDAPLPDAPVDMRPPEWTVVETRTVDCDGDTITSMTVIPQNEEYRLRASGTCVTNDENFGDESRGDAEYAGYNIGELVDTYEGVDIGIAVNHTGGGAKNPDWGAYKSSHVYEATLTGLGATITLRYREPNYSNNSGNLTVEILRFQ